MGARFGSIRPAHDRPAPRRPWSRRATSRPLDPRCMEWSGKCCQQLARPGAMEERGRWRRQSAGRLAGQLSSRPASHGEAGTASQAHHSEPSAASPSQGCFSPSHLASRPTGRPASKPASQCAGSQLASSLSPFPKASAFIFVRGLQWVGPPHQPWRDLGVSLSAEPGVRRVGAATSVNPRPDAHLRSRRLVERQALSTIHRPPWRSRTFFGRTRASVDALRSLRFQR